MTTGPTDSFLCSVSWSEKYLPTKVPEDDIRPTDSSLCAVSFRTVAKDDDDNYDDDGTYRFLSMECLMV